jgi:hypothetical protein
MNISSVSSASPNVMSGPMRRPDPTKMAEDLFSKLDTKGQGYIEKSDLEAALSKASGSGSSGNSNSSSIADEMFTKLDGNSDGKVTKAEMSATIKKIAAELDGPAPRMRMQGGMPPPQKGAEGASSTDSSAAELDPADTNGDGQVSTAEKLAYEASKSPTTTQTASSSSTSLDDELMHMLAGNMPPPRDSGQDDQGFSKGQLATMSKELGSTDSQRSKLMGDIADNFTSADVNGDGKVTGSEARAYEDSKNVSGTDSNTDGSVASAEPNADAKFMKQMMQLLHSYGGFDQSSNSSSFSESA